MRAAAWRELTRNTLRARTREAAAGGLPFLGIPPNELKYIAHIAFDGYTAFVKDERITPNTMRAIILCCWNENRKNGPGQKLYSCSFLSPGARMVFRAILIRSVSVIFPTQSNLQLNMNGGEARQYVYNNIMWWAQYLYIYYIILCSCRVILLCR